MSFSILHCQIVQEKEGPPQEEHRERQDKTDVGLTGRYNSYKGPYKRVTLLAQGEGFVWASHCIDENRCFSGI